MSTFEYNDLYLKCQDTGIYHMFVFDMIGSKKMSPQYRLESQYKMIELMNKIYETLEVLETKLNKKILVFDRDFVTYKSNLPYKGFGFKQEPFLFGDTFGFTIYRDSLDEKLIYDIYFKIKKELNIEFDFHLSNGYYETNNYLEGQKKYFRGYCMDLLSTFHKKDTQLELTKLKRKIKL